MVKDSEKLKKANRATAQKCPINLRKSSDILIEELLQAGIIERMLHHTDHTSGGSYIPKKNGSARLVMDYRVANKCIARPRCPMMRINEIKGKVQPNWKYFS